MHNHATNFRLKASWNVLLGVWHDWWLSGSLGQKCNDGKSSKWNLRISVENILQSETWSSESRALKGGVDSGKLTWSIVRQSICNKCVRKGVDQDSCVLVEDAATGKDGSASTLQLCVRDTNITSIVQGTGGIGVLLRLDDLIEDAVDVGGRYVCRVTSVVAKGVDEGAVVGLLSDSWSAARGRQSRAQELSFNGAVVVWADSDLVAQLRAG